MKVRSPDGRTWRVSRRWVPWRRRLKGALDSAPDLPSGLGDDPVSAIIGLVFLVILLPFLLLVLVAGLELLVLLVVMPFAVGARIVLGRHWYVEVRRGWTPYLEEEAGDWQASGVLIHDLAARLERGDVPEPNLSEA
ncbi:hypothetical protein [Nocardioides sp. TF02-7]|uniref:hypothetical protein n=1 Tax=Nocardioides sp. TF02-7 TaxID=2917724 RepID=UPI001F0638B0|nr:hypothetical protein [Nocardioides sp. TF02-7]UMG93328.1 hypothetical protein MF408_03355 [Nocardioides sp. TF02-7]